MAVGATPLAILGTKFSFAATPSSADAAAALEAVPFSIDATYPSSVAPSSSPNNWDQLGRECAERHNAEEGGAMGDMLKGMGLRRRLSEGVAEALATDDR